MPNEIEISEIPAHYPDWAKELFTAPADDLPGMLNDMWDCQVARVVEAEGSLTLYGCDDDFNDKDTPDVTFYGSRFANRWHLLTWIPGMVLGDSLAKAIKNGHQAPFLGELPLRLMLSEEEGNRVFGGPWE